ncbi:MAG TPA: PucR family transcriptional regulator ligand-binding domain-containing protein [Clostridia bacterium]|nr:PucR family transcriptional regulator ligand-binding domain-containing protein [Clostridia bacterium]
MQYTLRDFLADQPIPEIELLTGERDFSVIPLESVSVQEMPVDDFIRPNELVLSTALGCDDDPDMLERLIRDVASARAAAILLAFRDPRFRVPNRVLDYANGAGLPVFVIPWKHRFADISEHVAKRILDGKTKAYQKIQTELFSLYFDSKPLDAAAEAVCGFFQAPAVITDKEANARGVCRAFPGSGESFAQYARINIGINGILSGYLWLGRSGAGDSRANDPELIEKYVSFPLSMWFNKERIEDMVRMKFKNDFVWNLATGNYESVEEMARQGEKLRFDLNKPYTCITIHAAPKAPSAGERKYSPQAAENAFALESILAQEAKAMRLSVMYAERSPEFILFVENPACEPVRQVEAYANAVSARLSAGFPGCAFFFGISEITPDIHDFSRLYGNAVLALRYCMNAKGKKNSFTYKDTKEAQIISTVSHDPDIREMARRTLEKLLEYDRSSKADLLGTLGAFIRCNYNTSLTARELHIHRQSLLYRLEKIEALTEMSLKCHRDLFLLEVCTRIFLDY